MRLSRGRAALEYLLVLLEARSNAAFLGQHTAVDGGVFQSRPSDAARLVEQDVAIVGLADARKPPTAPNRVRLVQLDREKNRLPKLFQERKEMR